MNLYHKLKILADAAKDLDFENIVMALAPSFRDGAEAPDPESRDSLVRNCAP